MGNLLQPRLAYAATIEVPSSFCQSLASQDGGLAPTVSESDPNIDDVGNSASTVPSVLLKPTSNFPKPSYSTSNELMVSSTGKSSTSDLIPVYPGNPKGLVTQAETNRESSTSSTTRPDMIIMALADSSKTGARYGRNSPPSSPTVVNHDVGTSGPNFFTIDYNNVHRLPTNNADDSFLLSWFLPVTLILLLLILLVPACRLGKAWKARFLAGLQDDYRLQTGEMKEDSTHMKSEEEDTVPFDQVLTPKKVPRSLFSPFQLSPCPSPTVISSSPFSNVDVISLDGVCSLSSSTPKFDNCEATVITTKAEVYVIDGNESNHTPITTGFTNLVEPSQLNQIGNGYKSSQRGFSVSNVHSKFMPTATYESWLNEESHNKPLSMLQVISSNSQRFSSQNHPARSPPEKSQSPLIGEKTTKTLRDSGARRESLHTGWGKDSRGWGVRHTKSSLARRKVVEMMMATGNVHSHCHYPKTRTSRPHAVT